MSGCESRGFEVLSRRFSSFYTYAHMPKAITWRAPDFFGISMRLSFYTLTERTLFSPAEQKSY